MQALTIGTQVIVGKEEENGIVIRITKTQYTVETASGNVRAMRDCASVIGTNNNKKVYIYCDVCGHKIQLTDNVYCMSCAFIARRKEIMNEKASLACAQAEEPTNEVPATSDNDCSLCRDGYQCVAKELDGTCNAPRCSACNAPNSAVQGTCVDCRQYICSDCNVSVCGGVCCPACEDASIREIEAQRYLDLTGAEWREDSNGMYPECGCCEKRFPEASGVGLMCANCWYAYMKKQPAFSQGVQHA